MACCSMSQILLAAVSAKRRRTGGPVLRTSTTIRAKPRSRMSRSASTKRPSSSGENATTRAPGGRAALGKRLNTAPRAGRARRTPQPQVERGLPRLADVRGGVHEQHDVLRALGGERVHLQAAAAGGGRPVDRALPVAGDELADAGELRPVAGDPGPVLAQAVRQLRQHHLGALHRRGRVAVDGREGEADPAFGQVPLVVEGQGHAADPALAPARYLEREPRRRAVHRHGAARLDAAARVENPAQVAGVIGRRYVERDGLALVHAR